MIKYNICIYYHNIITIYIYIIDIIEGKKYNGLIITGHSLGGAMATLFAYELFKDYYHTDDFPMDKIYITTFGAPRVLDAG